MPRNCNAECSDLDELNCNHSLYGEGCEWIENDINCENISSESECDSNNCDWIEDIEYGNCSNLITLHHVILPIKIAIGIYAMEALMVLGHIVVVEAHLKLIITTVMENPIFAMK